MSLPDSTWPDLTYSSLDRGLGLLGPGPRLALAVAFFALALALALDFLALAVTLPFLAFCLAVSWPLLCLSLFALPLLMVLISLVCFGVFGDSGLLHTA